MSELAAAGVPVAVTCWVLKIARQPYYRWLARPVTAAELEQAYRANALFDAHRDDPEFGCRFLVDEARDTGEPMADRTAWPICSEHGWWSAFGRRCGKNGKKPGPPAHDDLVWRDFTATAPNQLWLAGRYHRAPHGRGQAVFVRGQGRLLQPDRGLFHRFQDEVPPRRGRAEQRRRPPR